MNNDRESIRQVLSSWLGASDCQTATDQIMRRLSGSGCDADDDRRDMLLPWRVVEAHTQASALIDSGGKEVAWFVNVDDAHYAARAINAWCDAVDCALLLRGVATGHPLEKPSLAIRPIHGVLG